MRSDLTDVTLVVDRSGSMGAILKDAQGGIDAFIKEQQAQPGETRLTIVEFDTNYDVVCDGVLIQDAPAYKLKPRGSTALLDAVGRAMATTGERLEKMPEDQRPGLVVFVITTDGEENASHEYSLEQVRAKIKEQQEKYNWKFLFLSAGVDAMQAGMSMGLSKGSVAQASVDNYGGTYAVASSQLSGMRHQTMSGQRASLNLSDEDRKKLLGG